MWFGFQFLATQNFFIFRQTACEKSEVAPISNLSIALNCKSVNAAELGSVVANEFGQVLKWAGVETVIVDNDKRGHSKTVTGAWKTFGINVWPGLVREKSKIGLVLLTLRASVRTNLVDFQ